MFKYVSHGDPETFKNDIYRCTNNHRVCTQVEYYQNLMFQNRMLNRIAHPMAPHKSPVPYEIEAVPQVVLQYLRDGGTPLYVYCTQRRYF